MMEVYETPLLVTGSITTIPSGTQNVNIISPAILDVNLVTPNPVPVTGTVDVNILTPNPIPVIITGSVSNPINIYAELLVPYATVTTVLSYTVPAAMSLNVTQTNCWGDTNGEFLVKVDGIVKGGGRTTAADPNFYGNYTSAPIVATTGQVVTITAEHYNLTSHIMKVTLLGGLV